jgi:hypothetical protein
VATPINVLPVKLFGPREPDDDRLGHEPGNVAFEALYLEGTRLDTIDAVALFALANRSRGNQL